MLPRVACVELSTAMHLLLLPTGVFAACSRSSLAVSLDTFIIPSSHTSDLHGSTTATCIAALLVCQIQVANNRSADQPKNSSVIMVIDHDYRPGTIVFY